MRQWKNIKKIGLGIMGFEGSEHLASVITELRDLIDYVVVGVLEKSYHGEPIAIEDKLEIESLHHDGLIDKILVVENDLTKEPRHQEADKRNAILDDMEKQGCSHTIVIDADEFYTHSSFLKALTEIDENDYEQTYCQYINYYTLKSFLVYPFKDGMYVPFIMKSKYRVSYDSQDFDRPSDPTRRYLRPFHMEKDKKVYEINYHVFPWSVVKMHHFSWMRTDIRKKLSTWSSKKCFKNYDDLIDKAVDTYEHFDDTLNEDQDVTLLFNTPDNKVTVRHFPKQYVFPKYDYRTRCTYIPHKKKILILNLCDGTGSVLFKELEKACRLTWAKQVLEEAYENIAYYSVVGSDDIKKSYIDEENRTIYVTNKQAGTVQGIKCQNDIYRLSDRFIQAVQQIDLSQYDYVLRTNTSTWVNVPLLDEFLKHEHDESKIYAFGYCAAFWSQFYVYGQGQALIFPVSRLRILTDLYLHMSTDYDMLASDDVLFSALLRQRGNKLGLNEPLHLVSLEGEIIKGTSASEEDYIKCLDFSRMFYQIKTFNVNDDERVKEDVSKMKQVNDVYLSRANDISSQYEKLKELMNNPTISVIPFIKSQWLEMDNQYLKDNARFNIMDYNKETLQFLEELKVKGGYVK